MKYLLISAMGFPTEFFTVLFAIPRMAGYLSHWRESLDDPDTKIMRPQQVILNFDDTCLPFFKLKMKRKNTCCLTRGYAQYPQALRMYKWWLWLIHLDH